MIFALFLGSRLGALLGLPMPEVRAIDVSEWLITNTPELRVESVGFSVPCVAGLQLASRYAADLPGTGCPAAAAGGSAQFQ